MKQPLARLALGLLVAQLALGTAAAVNVTDESTRGDSTVASLNATAVVGDHNTARAVAPDDAPADVSFATTADNNSTTPAVTPGDASLTSKSSDVPLATPLIPVSDAPPSGDDSSPPAVWVEPFFIVNTVCLSLGIAGLLFVLCLTDAKGRAGWGLLVNGACLFGVIWAHTRSSQATDAVVQAVFFGIFALNFCLGFIIGCFGSESDRWSYHSMV